MKNNILIYVRNPYLNTSSFLEKSLHSEEMEGKQFVKLLPLICTILFCYQIYNYYYHYYPTEEKSVQSSFTFDYKDRLTNNSLKGVLFIKNVIGSEKIAISKIIINFEIRQEEGGDVDSSSSSSSNNKIVETLEKQLNFFEKIHDRLENKF